MKKELIGISLIAFIVLIFFRSVIFSGKIPIPADTIVGLYHPFRDAYSKEYPRGIPYKNSLITDPVRQQYPWRYLAVSMEKNLQFPLWNPYSFSGTPLLGNFQTASFYPLNILFVFFPFDIAWSMLVILQPLFGGIFMYLYLRYLKLERLSSILGSIVFAFSGSSIVWMQWNTIFHTVMWLPLILLAKEHLLKKISTKWIITLAFAEISAIFAGHLQTLFYTMLISNIYLFARLWQIYAQNGDRKTFIQVIKSYKIFLLIGFFVFIITSIQLIPTLQFILLSARDVDQILLWKNAGWFVPWQHLIQFIVPDFFGNPATLNYWGVWNYAEFAGYISIFPLIISLFALLYRRDKKTLFFGFVFIVSLLFALPTFISSFPFVLNIPFISTSQPTRLIIIVNFALAVLTALGLDYYLKKGKAIYLLLLLFVLVFVAIWVFVLLGYNQFSVSLEQIMIAKRNLILPTTLFIIILSLLTLYSFIKNKKMAIGIPILLILVTIFDLFRFADKFLPYTQKNYLFPTTKTIEFLQKNTGIHRIMSVDDRILPPNFSTMYKLQTIEGYDPLYLRRYAELIAASERGNPNISPPFGFNRIITPKNFESKIIDILGVKYVLSLSDISSPKLKKVFQEGQTRVYENKNVFPRAFLVGSTLPANNKKDVIDAMFDFNYFDLKKVAFVEDAGFTGNPKDIIEKPKLELVASVDIIEYSENKVVIRTESNQDARLVLTDSYYPAWRAEVDGTSTKIEPTNYNFRSVNIPSGKHTVEFYATLF